MTKKHFKQSTSYCYIFLSLIGCCLMTFLAACGPQSATALSATQLAATNNVNSSTTGGTTSHVTTAPMPPTRTDCPANGQGRAAITAPLALGSHQNLVYVYNSSGAALLKRYDVSTGAKTTIVSLPNTAFYSAQLSTDGQFILFVTQYAHHAQIQMIRLDGQGLQTLYCAKPGNGIPNYVANMLWSPNQQLAVFEESNPGGAPGAALVRLLNLSSGAVQTYITPTTRSGYTPQEWLNNTEVYMTGSYFSNIAAPHDVYILDISKGTDQVNNTRQVASIIGYNWEMNLSTDGSKLILSQCSDSPGQDAPSSPSIISSQNATGGTLNPIYISHVHAVTQARVISPNTMLMALGGKLGAGAEDGLWKINMDGTGLVHLTTDGRLLSNTRTTWSSVSRNGNLYAVIGYNYIGNSDKFPFKVFYGSLSGGSPTQIDMTNAGENASIVGWTTM